MNDEQQRVELPELGRSEPVAPPAHTPVHTWRSYLAVAQKVNSALALKRDVLRTHYELVERKLRTQL